MIDFGYCIFSHNVKQRLAIDNLCVQFVDGDLEDKETLVASLSGQDLVFLSVPLPSTCKNQPSLITVILRWWKH